MAKLVSWTGFTPGIASVIELILCLCTIEFALVNDLVEKQGTIANQLVLLALIIHADLHVELALKHVEADLDEHKLDVNIKEESRKYVG